MCGIAGFVDLSGREPADAAVLAAMLGTMVHRGPDGSGTLIHGACAIGMRRLSIIDVAGSNQPLFNETRTLALVGNGEIFNYLELRAELSERGHVFATNGDLEVVLHLFEEMGPALTARLNGQFSLAILDLRSGDLLLLRDPFGVTPLHYALFGNVLVFASEIKAILRHPAASAVLDLAGLDQALCFPGLVSPRTLFKGVSSLPAGHLLTAGDGRVTSSAYWDLDYPPDGRSDAGMDLKAAVAMFTTLFDDSVRRRLRSDVPVGVYLSGGLDSSYLAASVRATSPQDSLTTLSIVFPDNRAINERRFQLLMARELGSHHVEIPFDPRRIADEFRQMIWHCECAVTETYNVCSLAMAAAARAEGVKVILGGEGADELLAGYPGYRFDELTSNNGGERLDLDEVAVRQALWGDPAIRYERRYAAYRPFRNRFFSPAAQAMLATEDGLSGLAITRRRLVGRHPVHQRSYLDVKLRLADHLLGDHGDRMAMASSVEGRFPFLDPDLVTFLARVPPHLKLNGMDEKFLLKEAARTRVPEPIRRREKFGFRAPGSGFLLSCGIDWIDEALSSDRIARDGIFDPEALGQEIARHKSGAEGANPHAADDIPLMALSVAVLIERFGISSIC